jgi:magnesium chelatase family protein
MGRSTLNPAPADVGQCDQAYEEEIDLAEVKGQESVKRALEIAATGGHNVLIVS